MRKQNKIVSLVLVLALLLGVIVVLPASPVVASAADETDSFTPSAVFSQFAETLNSTTGEYSATLDSGFVGEVVSTESGNKLGTTALGIAKTNDYLLYSVKEANGNVYGAIAPEINGTGTKDMQYTFSANVGMSDASSDGYYYVVSVDVSTDSDYIDGMYMQPVVRNGAGATTNHFADSVYFSDILGDSVDGEWHNVTFVGDMAANKLYIYLDGELRSDLTRLAYRTASTTYDSTNTYNYTFKGIKISNSVNAIYPQSTADSVLVDNLYANVYSGCTAIQDGWIGIAGKNEGNIPVIATVNGVEYYNANALNDALAYLPAQVELQRQFIGTVTVNCDATVETNGCSASFVAGENVTISANGTVTTYDAPHRSSVTLSADAGKTGTGVYNATADSTTVRVDLSGNYSDTTVVPYVVTDEVTGNQYLDIRAGATFSTTDSTHNHFNWITQNTAYQAGTYFVIEFDTYAEAEIMDDLYIGVTARNGATVPASVAGKTSDVAAGANYGGAGRYIKNWGLPVGEWAHVAMIGEVDSNTIYVYVNGVRVDSATNGLWGSVLGTDLTYAPYFQGIRVNVATQTNLTAEQNFALDNLTYKMNISDEWLSENYGDTTLDGWSGNDYELPALPVLASVDGVTVGSSSALSAELVGNAKKNVELLRDYLGTVTVNCDAVIETNGYTAPVVGSEVTVSNVGTLYTYDAPYQQSANKTEVYGADTSAIIAAIKSDASGNLFAYATNQASSDAKGNSNATSGSAAWLVTNVISGDEYLEVQTVGTPDNNYFEVRADKNILPNDNTQFIVVEMDATVYTSDNVTFSPVARQYNTTTGIWGAGGMSLNTILAGYSYGEMQHVTAVFNIDTNDVYVFANGNLVVKSTENAYTSDANHTTYWLGGAGVRFDGIRLGSTLANGGGYAVDNVNIQYVEDAASGYAANSITAAIAASDITVWENANIETATQSAPLAIVDGEYVYSVDALNTVLDGRHTKTVELLRDESSTITVNCSATVETNGLTLNLAAGENIASSSTNGSVTTYVASWKSSVSSETETSSDGAKVSGITASTVGNLVSDAYIQNWNSASIGYYTVTPAEGDVYGKLVANASLTTANHFVNVGFNKQVLDFTTDYYVIELDYAAEGSAIESFSLNPVITWSGSTSSGDRLDPGTGVYPAKLGINDGNWHHIALVAELSTNTLKVYVDGDLVATKSGAAYKAESYTESTEYWVSALRYNIGGAVEMNVGDSVSLDNFSFRVFSSASDVSFGTAAAQEKLPSIATVNGVEYSSLDSLTAALSDGKNLAVSLDRAVAGAAYASTTATITTNGVANFVKAAYGYTLTDNGDGTYTVAPETKMGSITVNINGVNAIKADVLYGTDIAEYLNLHNSYVFDIVSADNGQVYTGATWDATPAGTVDGDEVYNVTATAATDAVVIRDASGNAVTGDFEALLKAASTNVYVYVMNADHEMQSGNHVIQGNHTIYMAGHTLTFAAATGGAHALNLQGNAKGLTFINGNIVDNVRSTTQSVFYIEYPFYTEVKCVGVNLYAVGNLATIRGGTVTFEDCSITMLECQNSYAFQLCEYYNAGYTYNKCTLNLIDTDIQFTHFTSGRTYQFIASKDYSEWSGTPTEANKQAALAAGADTLQHEVNISGCNINLDFNAYLYSSINSNCNVNIDNSQLNLSKLYNSCAGTFTIGDNVYSATQLGGVTFAKGVTEVKSNNPNAPYLYANDYATVVWADGTVEKWADGSYPVNSDSTYVVSQVEAGQSYNFVKGEPELSMKANITLSANLKLNVYLPTSASISAVNISGVEYDLGDGAVKVTIDGNEYYQFSYELAPYHAAGTLTIAVSVGENTYTKAISLVDYADLVASAYASDANALNLVKAILQYVAEASEYMGAYSDGYNGANGYADADAVTLPTEGTNTMSNVNAYLSSASLDLSAAPKWAFAIVDGADLSNLTVKVDGMAVEYTVSDGYVYVELPAYDMLKTLTVSVGGLDGQYNFAAYYLAQVALADSLTDPSTTSWRANSSITEAHAYHSIDLLEAFYAYATYAAAYNA